MNRLLATVFAALLIVGSSSEVQSGERPFQGESSGAYTDNARGYEVSGQATHLGHFQATLGVRTLPQTFFRVLLDIFRDVPLQRTSQVLLVAADGSTLQGTIRYDTFDAETLTAVAEITISGGTGRFVDAVGTIDAALLFASETLLECDVLMEGPLDY